MSHGDYNNCTCGYVLRYNASQRIFVFAYWITSQISWYVLHHVSTVACWTSNLLPSMDRDQEICYHAEHSLWLVPFPGRSVQPVPSRLMSLDHANVIASTFRPSKGHSSFRFSPTKQLYVFLFSPMRETCSVHRNHIKVNPEGRNSNKILYVDDKWLDLPHNYCNQFHCSLVSRYDNTSLPLQITLYSK
jgi:hypothetical protein